MKKAPKKNNSLFTADTHTHSAASITINNHTGSHCKTKRVRPSPHYHNFTEVFSHQIDDKQHPAATAAAFIH